MTINYIDFLAALSVNYAHPGGLFATYQSLDNLNVTDSSKILEIGCGTGQTTATIADMYTCEIIGIDNNDRMVAQASGHLRNNNSVTVQKASAEFLPFESNIFDVIISESVLVFTSIDRSLREASRVIKPKGKLILLEMTKEKTLTQSEEEEIKQFYGVTAILSELEWIAKLHEYGFTINTIENVKNDGKSEATFNNPDVMDDTLLDLMIQHYNMNEKYKHKLGARIYFCQL